MMTLAWSAREEGGRNSVEPHFLESRLRFVLKLNSGGHYCRVSYAADAVTTPLPKLSNLLFTVANPTVNRQKTVLKIMPATIIMFTEQ